VPTPTPTPHLVNPSPSFLPSDRSIDWSQTGIFGGIRVAVAICTTSACNTAGTPSGGVTLPESISSHSAPANTVVKLDLELYRTTRIIQMMPNVVCVAMDRAQLSSYQGPAMSSGQGQIIFQVTQHSVMMCGLDW